MKPKIGYRLYSKEVQLSIRKAATKAPTNIRNIVPGPRIVPPINIIWKQKNIMCKNTQRQCFNTTSKNESMREWQNNRRPYLSTCNLWHTFSYLISNIRRRDIIVDFDRVLIVNKQVHDVRESGWHPATALVVELVKTFRAVRVSVGGRRVLYSVTSLEQKCA